VRAERGQDKRDSDRGGTLAGRAVADGLKNAREDNHDNSIRIRVECDAEEPMRNNISHTKPGYEKELNRALAHKKDVWGQALLKEGHITYDSVKDYLRPLFYGTKTYDEIGVHNLVWAENGGGEPYIVPIADGSRICLGMPLTRDYLAFFVGRGFQEEKYGSNLKRLEGPVLEGGYYPILRNAYTDKHGIRYTHESYASWVPGVKHLVAFVKLTVNGNHTRHKKAVITVHYSQGDIKAFSFTGSPKWEDACLVYDLDISGNKTREIYIAWSPVHKSYLPDGMKLNKRVYNGCKRKWKDYWDTILGKGAEICVPDPMVMNACKNLLIQNLILRWHYSAGNLLYYHSLYKRENSDALSSLGLFGFLKEYKQGLVDLMSFNEPSPGFGDICLDWGEELSHAAHYYCLSNDKAFILRNTERYKSRCVRMRREIKNDPHGILQKQAGVEDLRRQGYWLNDQATCWRGMRDVAVLWRELGKDKLYKEYFQLSKRFRTSLIRAAEKDRTCLDDGSVFVPCLLMDKGENRPYDHITETRQGTYWNLLAGFYMGSGLWDYKSDIMGKMLKYLDEHGAFFLGLLRCNFYPTKVGEYQRAGRPGYYTTGIDDVYHLDYARIFSERGEADRQVLTLYSKLAHGMTRDTFVNGEGATLGTHPEHAYRSSYGCNNSSSNALFLILLRHMLLYETFSDDTGVPEGLYLAYATPRHWLEHGEEIAIERAPTCFGELSYTVRSKLKQNKVLVDIVLPRRRKAKEVKIKIRVPDGTGRMKRVVVDGREHAAFDAEKEIIDISGYKGRITMVVHYGSSV